MAVRLDLFPGTHTSCEASRRIDPGAVHRCPKDAPIEGIAVHDEALRAALPALRS